MLRKNDGINCALALFWGDGGQNIKKNYIYILRYTIIFYRSRNVCQVTHPECTMDKGCEIRLYQNAILKRAHATKRQQPSVRNDRPGVTCGCAIL